MYEGRLIEDVLDLSFLPILKTMAKNAFTPQSGKLPENLWDSSEAAGSVFFCSALGIVEIHAESLGPMYDGLGDLALQTRG